MKKKVTYSALVLAFTALSLAACKPNNPVSSLSSESSALPSSSQPSSSSAPASTSSFTNSHTQAEVDAYVAGLKTSSKANHLYFHYMRYENTVASYSDWDLWVWAYSPKAGEGAKFDWDGRTTTDHTKTGDKLTATGDAKVDAFGGAYADIDLTKTYDGGWSNNSRAIGGTSCNYYQKDGTTLDTQIGIQIVKTSSRWSSSSFWTNDSSNIYVTLSLFAFANSDNSTSYHIFVVQDKAQDTQAAPIVAIADPFKADDGKNVTYGQAGYNNADWTNKPLAATSPMFLKGTDGGASAKENGKQGSLVSGAGVGYQIMVASYADSDGDGMGDLYGIDQKLDYIKNLGVNVLWLTPIQMSDSYHGYDITDYSKVDPKFGSKVSPASTAASGAVTTDTAMADYQKLLSDAHSKGMLVIMDLVLNHTSTGNNWFVNSAQLDKDYRGYYQWGNHETDAEHINEKKYWYPYGDHVYSYYAKFGSSMPELNYAYTSTRAAVTAMAKNWCEVGVDGFRMDAVKHIFLNDEVTAGTNDTIISDVSSAGDYSSNLTKNLNFWRQLNAEVKADYPNAFFVGENFDGHAYHVAPFYEGFDSLFDFYSYFNITDAAAHAQNSSVGAGITSYDGASSGTTYAASSDTSLSGKKDNVKGGNWNLGSVLATENLYRSGDQNPSNEAGFTSMNGAFTSNHDIARCLNRVAENTITVNGTTKTTQGVITEANYQKYLASATCAEIAELMLPGCTWIYYGDEIGMSGNFPDGVSSGDGYADLWYRQPMKWKQAGAVGDGSFTTGYAITGSGSKVQWDDFNSTDKVPGADDATSLASNAHYQAIKAFATAKGTTPALIRGNYVAEGWQISGQDVDFIFNVTRTLGTSKYHVVVNFSATTAAGSGLTGDVIASYNGATLTNMPALSAILVKEA